MKREERAALLQLVHLTTHAFAHAAVLPPGRRKGQRVKRRDAYLKELIGKIKQLPTEEPQA